MNDNELLITPKEITMNKVELNSPNRSFMITATVADLSLYGGPENSKVYELDSSVPFYSIYPIKN